MQASTELAYKMRQYIKVVDEELIRKAYDYSFLMHSSQTRDSGDCFFSHPLFVANLLTNLHLDQNTITAGLLHDVVEDTDVTIEDIKSIFGSDIASLVDGVTKLSKFQLQSQEAKQAENFRKFLVAMSNDIRVLLIKLADRLHNMQTLNYIKKPERRHKIARETLQIYAPIAERMGIFTIQNELENLSFETLYPSIFSCICDQLKEFHLDTKDLTQDTLDALEAVFKKHHLTCTIQGREKTPYSIWEKMKRKNIPFQKLSDIVAFRIIVDRVEQCYQALGIIHQTYPVVPGRFKDYISLPKQNGYKSIHTCVIGPFNQRIEIQIRTFDMDAYCRLGVAAHWSYKKPQEHKDGRKYVWLKNALEILESTHDVEEFLEHTKFEMFSNEVFVFSSHDQILSLPKGSTALDFVYALFPTLADYTQLIRINGRPAELHTVLLNGDQIDVHFSHELTICEAWEWFVMTGKAKTAIQKFLKNQKKKQFIKIGIYMFQNAIKHQKLPYVESIIQNIIKQLHINSVQLFWEKLGRNDIQIADVLALYILPSPEIEKNFDPQDANITVHDPVLLEDSSANHRLLSTHIPQIKKFKNVFKVVQMIVVIKNTQQTLEEFMKHVKRHPLYCLSIECIEKNEDYQKISIEFEVCDVEKMTILKNDLIKIQGVDSINF